MQKHGLNRDVVIMGAGLAGLSAGFALSESGRRVVLLEAAPVVGGLARTVVHDGFRFDLGGHRFFTTNPKIETFVKELMGKELLNVERRSKIYLQNKYFDYPLKPQNAILGLGIVATLKMLSGYCTAKLRNLSKKIDIVTLEDWVVSQFGRPMFELYFKTYSEKVWGIKCEWISAEWVSQRIKGLSLGSIVKNALFKLKANNIPTLTDRFLYPQLGIGRIAERLKDVITNNGSSILTNTRVEQIYHSDFRIQGIITRNGRFRVNGSQYISSIPITTLVQLLYPPAPADILDAASHLRYRDIVVVAVMINRSRITNQSWIYFPEKDIPFARLHEPTNWSKAMAPDGKTLIVVEYFCFQGDKTWNIDNLRLSELTIHYLENLQFIRQNEVIDTVVIKVPDAYPLLEVGYREHYDKLHDYLGRFKNLYLTGRCGMFKYRNIDHVIESGLQVAESIISCST
jgi:protoporphyrinogen oxidase